MASRVDAALAQLFRGTLLSRFSCHSPERLSKACLIRVHPKRLPTSSVAISATWHVIAQLFESGLKLLLLFTRQRAGKADTADGLDDAVGLDLFELAPQIAHIYIDHVVVAEVVLTPDVLDQLGAA